MPSDIVNKKGGVIKIEGNTPTEVERIKKSLCGTGSQKIVNEGEIVIRVYQKDQAKKRRRI